jgi:hypothetical protein
LGRSELNNYDSPHKRFFCSGITFAHTFFFLYRWGDVHLRKQRRRKKEKKKKKKRTMGVLWDLVFDNSYQKDSKEAEAAVRKKYPLLLHSEETILFAFKDRGGKGRDKEYFTSHRILIKDGKGVGSKRKNYQSILYSSIQAWSVESAGSIDTDVELHIWGSGVPHISIDFAKSNVDIFQLQQLLNLKVKWSEETSISNNNKDAIDSVPPNMDKKQSAMGNMMDWLGDNAKQIDTAQVEQKFKTEIPILLANETVEIAFQSGRDTKAFTNKRLLLVNVKGIMGKKIEFTSILWSCVQAYSVQTAGAFLDRDTEMKLYTNITAGYGELAEIAQDFRNGKANLFAIQKTLCNHILGQDDTTPALMKDSEIELREGQADPRGNWWFRDNQRPLDAVEMDKVYHSDPAILQASERVEFAFKGRRDITMFTTKRLIIIDPKGLFGKQVQYTSIPWEKIVAYAVRTSGRFLDFDTEVCFWTEMAFEPGQAGGGDDNPPVPPSPYMSYL